MKFAKSREVEGRILNVTVRRNPSGKYFVSILVETEIQALPPRHSWYRGFASIQYTEKS